MAYTPVTAKGFREKKGTLSEKLATEFTAIQSELDTSMLVSEPPSGSFKKITNMYYNPDTGELLYTAEA